MDKKIYTAREICKNRTIYWIKSYKATLKYMRIYDHILKPTTMGRSGSSSKRYYIKEENLKEFVRKFENSELV